eukprot:2777915-Prymnesium_polylepis.1
MPGGFPQAFRRFIREFHPATRGSPDMDNACFHPPTLRKRHPKFADLAGIQLCVNEVRAWAMVNGRQDILNAVPPYTDDRLSPGYAAWSKFQLELSETIADGRRKKMDTHDGLPYNPTTAERQAELMQSAIVQHTPGPVQAQSIMVQQNPRTQWITMATPVVAPAAGAMQQVQVAQTAITERQAELVQRAAAGAVQRVPVSQTAATEMQAELMQSAIDRHAPRPVQAQSITTVQPNPRTKSVTMATPIAAPVAGAVQQVQVAQTAITVEFG